MSEYIRLNYITILSNETIENFIPIDDKVVILNKYEINSMGKKNELLQPSENVIHNDLSTNTADTSTCTETISTSKKYIKLGFNEIEYYRDDNYIYFKKIVWVKGKLYSRINHIRVLDYKITINYEYKKIILHTSERVLFIDFDTLMVYYSFNGAIHSHTYWCRFTKSLYYIIYCKSCLVFYDVKKNIIASYLAIPKDMHLKTPLTLFISDDYFVIQYHNYCNNPCIGLYHIRPDRQPKIAIKPKISI